MKLQICYKEDEEMHVIPGTNQLGKENIRVAHRRKGLGYRGTGVSSQMQVWNQDS